MSRVLASILLALPLVAAPARSAAADAVDAKLRAVLNVLGPAREVDVIITLSDQVDPGAFRDHDRRLRRSRLNRALRGHAGRTQSALIAALRGLNAGKIKPLWIVNSIAARVPAAAIPRLTRLPGVASIKLDDTMTAPTLRSASAALPEWNLSTIRAPEMWMRGHTGAGIVVATMDTGVDVDHPDLAPRWRGGANSWFDPHLGTDTPHDAHGHGTQVMGLLVGGDQGGTAIGVAPGARWIAVKLFDNSGTTSLSKIHEAFEWLLDPDGDPDVDDAPDIVNNSWYLQGTDNQCNGEFAPDIAALKAAGIAVVFAAGNTGPGAATSVSPSNDPEVVAVGAVDELRIRAGFSGRGPSACDGGIYPGIVAPGVSVRTADLTFGGLFPDSYASATGTSFATPHLSGAMALILGAMAGHGVTLTTSQLEAAIGTSAIDLGPAGPDHQSGVGLLDVVAAYEWLVANAGDPPTAHGAVVTTPEDAAVAITLTASGAVPLTYTVGTGPANGTLSGTPPHLTFTPAANFFGSTSFTFTASDGQATSNLATVVIMVTPVNDAPGFMAGADQAVTQPVGPQTVPNWATAISPGPANEAGQSVSFLVSSNNAALFATQPAVSPSGTLTYTPAPGALGTATLTVRARDTGGTAGGGVNTSAAQTRTITLAGIPSTAIFADGFESGNFAAWTGIHDRDGDLSVTTGAALFGGFGMAARIDDTTPMWVRDDTPTKAARYRARFHFHPNGLAMAAGDVFGIMAARSGKANAGVDVVRVQLRRATHRYQVRAITRHDAGGYVTTPWYAIGNAPSHIEIDWQRATAPGTHDGFLRFWTDGVLRRTLRGLDNDTFRINSVRLGPLGGIDRRTRGTVHFDGFASHPTAFIGPEP